MNPSALEDLWYVVRIAAEGSDWKRDEGETLAAWAERKLAQSPYVNGDAARFAWLLAQSASVQDSVLRPPIPPELLESPEKWGDLVRAEIDKRRGISGGSE